MVIIHDFHILPMFVQGGSTHSMMPYIENYTFPSLFHLFIGFYNSYNNKEWSTFHISNIGIEDKISI